MSEAEGRSFARDADYLRTLGVAVLLGLGVGVVATAFIVGLRRATDGLWPDESSYGTGFWEGEWWMVLVLAGGGLLVGLSRLALATPRVVNMFTELARIARG